ncbi:MAG: ATP-dependent DNA helicase [Lachnospiraceae bacterium]
MKKSTTIDETTKEEIRISVRNLVEFVLRHGDIDNRISRMAPKDAMQEGGRIHRKIQRQMGSDYRSEVMLKFKIEKDDFDLLLEGRADGIVDRENGFLIDEIKGVYKNVHQLEEPVQVHLAQVKCYAFLYMQEQAITDPKIELQMTYVNLDTEEIRRFQIQQNVDELSDWFRNLIQSYMKWAQFQSQWRKITRASAKELDFPYSYREGQKKLVEDVYRSILRKKTLFIQAPTGAGKTIATIYPGIKASGEGLIEKIFYLTAKTITGTVAKETFELFAADGYRAKVIQITAKEKMCLCDEMECNPDHCSYAKGHYDRINDTVFELLQMEDNLDRDIIQEYAKKFQVCPFEFSLDLATWSDHIICDYNYLFDPNVYLKRFFSEGSKGDYLFLVDEAHNLVERGRDMYSASLLKEDFLEVKKLVRNLDKKLVDHLNRCNKAFLNYKRECESFRIIEDDLAGGIFALQRLAERFDRILERQPELPDRSSIMEFYFKLRNFLYTYDRVDERYEIYSEIREDESFMIRLFCVDPSYLLQQCINKGRSTVLFSATLLPIQYYMKMLSTKDDNYAIYAKSVFQEEQKLLCIAEDVSSKYTRRNEAEFKKIAEYIYQTVAAQTGNYMVFFPSYKMLEQIFTVFQDNYKDEVFVISQSPNMNEMERESFLEAFEHNPQKSIAGFCVLGGIFGEGIDLTGSRLIGTIIVGTGLPQVGTEREILKQYFDRVYGAGFDFSYTYPGLNKVLQAAGRVIRTTEDFGTITLLDERFLRSSYKKLFPLEWEQFKICRLDSYTQYLSDFWKKL